MGKYSHAANRCFVNQMRKLRFCFSFVHCGIGGGVNNKCRFLFLKNGINLARVRKITGSVVDKERFFIKLSISQRLRELT